MGPVVEVVVAVGLLVAFAANEARLRKTRHPLPAAFPPDESAQLFLQPFRRAASTATVLAGIAAVVSFLVIGVISAKSQGMAHPVRDAVWSSGPPNLFTPWQVLTPLTALTVFLLCLLLQRKPRLPREGIRVADLTASARPPFLNLLHLSRIIIGLAGLLIFLAVVALTAAHDGTLGLTPTFQVVAGSRSSSAATTGWTLVIVATSASAVCVGLLFLLPAQEMLRPFTGPRALRSAHDRVAEMKALFAAKTTATCLLLAAGVGFWSRGATVAHVAAIPTTRLTPAVPLDEAVAGAPVPSSPPSFFFAQPTFALGITELIVGVILTAVAGALLVRALHRVDREPVNRRLTARKSRS